MGKPYRKTCTAHTDNETWLKVCRMEQMNLFHGGSDPGADFNGKPWTLPTGYTPHLIDEFDVKTIILCKGSVATDARRRFVECICDLYPSARIIDRTDVSHNKIELESKSPSALHQEGKRTLVFGELGDSVRFSDEENNACPNYWHFSVYGFCPYGCRYCYLAGTQGVWFSPTVKIFVNLPEIIERIDRIAKGFNRPTAFYSGKLQDGIALDPLTAYSTVLVPYFAGHPCARQTILTKSDRVERYLDLDHNGHTILSWSLNPPEIADRHETNVPSVEKRIAAMKKCSDRGYPVRAVVMPIILQDGWRDLYRDFLRDLIKEVPLERLTFGGICMYQRAMKLMNEFLGKDNTIAAHIHEKATGDGRIRYSHQKRVEIYRHLISTAKSFRPDLHIALCLETVDVWKDVGISQNIGQCNCVL